MRRLKILLYWLFGNKNNVSIRQLAAFLTKARVEKIARPFVVSLESADRFIKVQLKDTPQPLYWPSQLPLDLLYQVVTETFDPSDWHYYQKRNTTVAEQEILLDVGAAEGLFSLTVAPRCKQIILVEPNEVFYTALQHSFAPYSGKTTIYKTAVGNTEGFVNFADNHLAGQVTEKGGVAVPITRIDQLIQKDQPITFLKADIEGFEYEMLQGARETIIRNKPKIAITTYHDENNAQAIIDLVLSYVPTYQYRREGIFEKGGKPVMLHFWH